MWQGVSRRCPSCPLPPKIPCIFYSKTCGSRMRYWPQKMMTKPLWLRIWMTMSSCSMSHSSLLTVLQEHLSPAPVVILRGTPEAMLPWQQRINRESAGRVSCYAIAEGEDSLPAVLQSKPVTANVTATCCQQNHCVPALQTLPDLDQELARMLG